MCYTMTVNALPAKQEDYMKRSLVRTSMAATDGPHFRFHAQCFAFVDAQASSPRAARNAKAIDTKRAHPMNRTQ